jgi:hypothetical protein
MSELFAALTMAVGLKAGNVAGGHLDPSVEK